MEVALVDDGTLHYRKEKNRSSIELSLHTPLAFKRKKTTEMMACHHNPLCCRSRL